MDNTIQPTVPEEQPINPPLGQIPPNDPPARKKSWIKYLLISIPVILVVIGGFYFLNSPKTEKSSPTTLTTKAQVKQTAEIAIHTYFKGEKTVQTIREENKKYEDGSLETIVTSDNKQLSRQLFLKDKILSLRDGVLTQQIFKGSARESDYKTSGEYFLTLVKNMPNLSQTKSNLNGESVLVYTIGGSKKNSFRFIPQVFAANPANITKIYINEETRKLKKVESIEPSTNNPTEEIVYEIGPSLMPQPLAPEPLEPKEKQATAPEELKPLTNEVPTERQEVPQENLVPEVNIQPMDLIEEFKKEARESQDIIVDTSVPITPTSEPMTIFPLSVIPTESGYNTVSIDVISNAFRIIEFREKSLKESGSFDPEQFVLNNIRIRVDGAEIKYQNFNISVDSFYGYNPNETTGFIRFTLPKNLQPGYHTVEIFAADTWFLAPNLMVTLPQPGEDTLELQLDSQMPPTAVGLPNNQGFKITLSSKNLVKPFTVILTSTQGEKFEIKDSNVSVNGEGKLVLNLPASFRNGIYSLTIIKGSQTVYRPNYISVSEP